MKSQHLQYDVFSEDNYQIAMELVFWDFFLLLLSLPFHVKHEALESGMLDPSCEVGVELRSDFRDQVLYGNSLSVESFICRNIGYKTSFDVFFFSIQLENVSRYFTVYSHLRFIMHELFSPRNCQKWIHNSLLNFLVHVKVNQIANVNAPT